MHTTVKSDDERVQHVKCAEKRPSLILSKREHENACKTVILTGPETLSAREFVARLNISVQAKYSQEGISRDEISS
ncbi:3271_t:CDS:2 [Funneliformis mosseae]|uniref:3271_t:CDS:1 n=1 Tax=Funneliformis mosseae TaxID=27381 RepID=A0A9N9B1K6_FUNMO|nr:3271_t:CDS:2 [Funneliformis mosseae]